MSSDFQVALLTAPADASRNLEQRSTLSFFERNVRELSPGGVRSSIFTLISTTLGAGVLALPFVLQQSGLIIGTMLIGVAGILALVTITIIMKASTRLGLKTYAQIVAHCAGSWAQEALDLVIFVYINGAMAAYFIFLGDFLPIVVRQFGAPVIFGQRWFIMLMGICIGIPMCMPRQLSSLRHVTPVSTLALLALSVTAVVYMPQLHADRSASGEEVCLSSITWSIIPSFNICMFSFVCHNNVVPVAVELDNPSDRRIMKVASSTAVGCCLFYFIIAQAGYLSFMDETGSNFLVNYPSQQFLPSLCRCLFIISLTVGVVVNNHSAVASFVGFLQRCVFSDSIRGFQYNANISDQANDVDSAGYIAEGVSVSNSFKP
jgi:amino acid permease